MFLDQNDPYKSFMGYFQIQGVIQIGYLYICVGGRGGFFPIAIGIVWVSTFFREGWGLTAVGVNHPLPGIFYTPVRIMLERYLTPSQFSL